MAEYTLPDLPYDYAALEPHVSGQIMELHHDKHHAAYVTGANQTLEKLAGARDKDDFGAVVGLEKALAFHTSGHVLHSIFWKNLSPDGGDKPDGALASAIDEHFGSFDKFKAHMTQATSTIQGSGWGALAWEPLGGRLIVEQIYDHQGNIGQGSVPLLRVRPRRVQPGRRYRLIRVAEHGEQASPALPVGTLVALAATRLAIVRAARLVPGTRGDHRAVGTAGPVSGADERTEFHDRNRPSRRQFGFGGQQ